MTRRAAVVATGVLTVSAVLAACGGPSEEETVATSEESRISVQQTADDLVERVRGLAGDLPLELDHVPSRDDKWSGCDDTSAASTADVQHIQWTADRTFYVDPPQETAPRLDAIIDGLVSEGWTRGDDTRTDGGRTISARRDGYAVLIGGDSRVVDGIVNTISVHVYGPCIDAPADLAETR